MKEVEIKLSEWHRLYKELGTVERLLAESLLRDAHAESERLRAQTLALRLQLEESLQRLNAAILDSRQAREKR